MWVDVYYKTGILNVMIKMTMVKYKVLYVQQKQTNQQAIVERLHHLLLVIVLCKKRQALKIMEITFFVVSNELILTKLLKKILL